MSLVVFTRFTIHSKTMNSQKETHGFSISLEKTTPSEINWVVLKMNTQDEKG